MKKINPILLGSMLVIISLITILIISLNPRENSLSARNRRRIRDLNSINHSFREYLKENNYELPDNMQVSKSYHLGTCKSGGSIDCNGAEDSCLDISKYLKSSLQSIPQDPIGGSDNTTLYTINIDSNRIVTTKSCVEDGGRNVTVAR